MSAPNEGTPIYANYPDGSRDTSDSAEVSDSDFSIRDTYPEIWVEATGGGKLCGNCHQLLTQPGTSPEVGVISEIPPPDRDARVSKICPVCGSGNRNALLAATHPSRRSAKRRRRSREDSGCLWLLLDGIPDLFRLFA